MIAKMECRLRCCWVVLLFLISSQEAAEAEVVMVNSTTSNCSIPPSINSSYQLQEALQGITSNIELRLDSGCHWLREFIPVNNSADIVINGGNDTVISCKEGIGLAFLNISDLTLRHVTILNCSLTGNHLLQVRDEIYSLVPGFSSAFRIDPTLVRVGIVIAHVTDALLDNVQVNDTDGIGLMAINVLGDFNIDSCVFFNNTPRDCHLMRTGGGLVTYYQNTTSYSYTNSSASMTVNNTRFLYNTNCDTVNTAQLIYSSFILSFVPFPVGGGGGLSVILAQSQYSVSVNVDRGWFRNNSANHGGGLFIGVFLGVKNTQASITDCTFERNGIEVTPRGFNSTLLASGQGIAIVVDLAFPPSHIAPFMTKNNKFIIENVVFKNNVAASGSAFLYYSRYAVIIPNVHSYLLRFNNCSFQSNKAYYGGAIYLTELKSRGDQEGTHVIFDSCSFEGNELLAVTSGFQSTSLQSSSIVAAIALNVTFTGFNSLKKNSGTPLHTRRSIVHIHDMLVISNNSGLYGGAMSLSSSSYVIFYNNSDVTLSHNIAFLQAGAIYFTFIDTNDAIKYYDCFIFFNKLNAFSEYDFDISDLNITIRFIQNDAPIATQVFGATLETCTWAGQHRNPNNSKSVFEWLEREGIFHFDPAIDNGTFGTGSYRFNVSRSDYYPVMPGQALNLDVIAYDRFEQSAAEVIYSNVDDNRINGPGKSYIDNSVYWFIHDRFTSTPLSMGTISEPPQGTEQQYPVSLFSVQSTSQYTLNISVRECYPGFEFNTSSRSMYKTCMCNAELAEKYPNIGCFAESVTFTVPNNLWLGPIHNGSKRLMAHTCLFDYCNSGTRNISGLDFSVQCRNRSNRTGLLCGQCKAGYSIQFGTNNCEKCSNISVLIIFYFIVAGVVVIGLIGKIGILVSHGFLNCIIFYSNIIVPFQYYLVMQYANSGANVFLYTFSAINLDVGFPVCFYNGMTTLARNYLNFLFPLYLWILMGLNVYLVKYKFCLKYILCNNRAGVFASVILLSYVSLLQACTGALSVTTVDDDKSLRWAPDPSVEYFSASHAPLALISIVIIIIYIIPFPILLIFPPLALKTRLGVRLIPVYDAFWAPYRTHFHFWIGLRLFARVLPFILSNFVPYPGNVFGLGLYIVFLIFLHVIVKPFKGNAQNLLDVYLLLNVLLLVMISLFTEAQIEYFDYTAQITDSIYAGYLAAIYGTLLLALAAVFLVVWYHLYIQYKIVRKCWMGSIEIMKRLFVKKKNKKKEEVKQGEKDDILPAINVANYSVLREPLLDYGEASLRPQDYS